jgi:hypothetical protein
MRGGGEGGSACERGEAWGEEATGPRVYLPQNNIVHTINGYAPFALKVLPPAPLHNSHLAPPGVFCAQSKEEEPVLDGLVNPALPSAAEEEDVGRGGA